MDQRVKGGSPPNTTEDATSAPKNSDKDHVPEKKRKAGAGEGNGDKGAVLELLIEGRCGTKGDQISGKDSSCPEGNVRLRIGLQAKRTKKPPKILESYVCKPTIRTYQRQGRGAQLRGEAEGGVGQQSKTSSSPDEATSREPLSGLDRVQTSSKQTASASSPEAPSSLSTISTLQPLSSAPTTTASAASAQRTKSSSQVPIKPSEKAEVISNGTSEKVKKSSLVNSLSASVEHKNSSPKTEELKSETSLTKKHNSVQASKQKGLSNGKGDRENSPALSDKSKSGKNSPSSSISSAAKLTEASSPKESSNKNKSPSISSVTSCQPQSQDAPNPLMQPTVEKRKNKKSKKEKRRDKKSKRDRLEAESKRSQSRSEESRKRKERAREEKTRHGKEWDEKHKSNDPKNEQVSSKNDKTPIQESQIENSVTKSSANIDCTALDEEVCVSRQEEQNTLDSNCREADPVETTGDTSKSKEQDISRHSSVSPSQPIPTVPASSPALSAPSSPPEQDSRPLKKRKARRPSWTRLVHRAQKAENHEATSDSQRNPSLGFPQNPKASLNPRTTDESHAATSSSAPKSSSPQASVAQSPSPKRSQPEPSPQATKNPPTPTRKRGRPKSSSSSEPPPKPSPNVPPTEVPLSGQDRAPSSVQLCATENRPSPRKRGRPPKRPVPNDHSPTALTQGGHEDRRRSIPIPEKGNRQLNFRRLINEMKRRKKRRFHKVMASGFVAKTADAKSIEATAVHTLSSLSSSLGGKLGPQINVSKRGTIYMGKRRGRKPKVQSALSHSSTQPSLFTSAPETSLFSTQPSASHPFPSPSLTHSSGAQSPYSEGSFSTDPAPCLLFSQPFSLPSPPSSCTSPRPPSSSSLSSFVRKSCPCQGRPHFPFHQSTCKLSPHAPPLQHTPGSPSHLKEATASPRSESHSEETLPSDSGIGTDNNSISERGEMRGGSRGMLRVGQSSGIILGSQKHPVSLLDQPSPVSPPLLSRHTNPNVHRDRHRHRRRDFDCSSSCACLCACSGLNNKCTHSDFYSCHGHNALKRQKNKHKKKHQQLLHLQDPEFLAELEDLIALFNEMHIGRRSWARAGLVQDYDGGAPGGRRHHSPHSSRSNIFRINLNGFYSPHPSAYSHNPPFPPQPLYTCHPVHCSRKLDRRQCACSSKFQDTIENIGMYRSYPSLYNHVPNSYTLSSPSQFALHQSPQHFFLNPARFHRRRSRLTREGGNGGEDGARGSALLGSGFTPNFPCGCGRGEHKHKHKHRHRHCDRDVGEDEIHEDEVEREGFVSKQRSGFIYRQEAGRKGTSRLGSVLSKESPWLSEIRRDSFSSVAASSASERFKQTPLTSLGLGSTHLSSFGGGWGALGHSWTKYGGLGGTTFGKPTWTGFSSETQHANKTLGVVEEDDGDDEEDNEESPLYGTSQPQVHTNLFTSAVVETGARGLRCGGDRTWRRNEPVWMERREAGSQSHSRNWGHQKTAQPSDDGSVHRRRGPGRPRKHPLPSVSSPVPPPMPSASSGFVTAPEVQAGTEAVRREARAESAQLMTEVALQANRKKGRKRNHSHSPCHQSVTEEKECETATESSGHSDVEQPVIVPRAERPDRPPRKNFLNAGLYSDDYKTTDPPSQNTHFGRESAEYSPEERDYSLLPAPLHVGKYLRLKRIHFQLPYDVMWLWQNDQLCRHPAVPLKRKRRYCRIKEKTLNSQANEEETEDITNLFPHLDMDPLTSCERSFVVKHHVFLLRNWELVRDRQIRLRIERERHRDPEEEEEEEEEEDDSHIKSDQPLGEDKAMSNNTHRSQDTSSSCSASPCPTNAPSRPEEKEEHRRGEEDVCSREQRRKRLNDLLLTLLHS